MPRSRRVLFAIGGPDELVITGTIIKAVVGIAVKQRVVIVLTEQPVVAGTAGHSIGTILSDREVVAVAAIQIVVARATKKGIIAVFAIEHVAPGCAIDPVVAAADLVVTAAHDEVLNVGDAVRATIAPVALRIDVQIGIRVGKQVNGIKAVAAIADVIAIEF